MTYAMPGNMTSLFDFLNYTHQQTITPTGTPILFPVLVVVIFVVTFISIKSHNNDASTSMFVGFLIACFFSIILQMMGLVSIQVLIWCFIGVIGMGTIMAFKEKK